MKFGDLMMLFNNHKLARKPASEPASVVYQDGCFQYGAAPGGASSNDAAPLATLTVRITSFEEVPVITITRCKTSLSGVTTATFTPTVLEDGHYRIAWPGGTFPAVSGSPPAQGHAAIPIRPLGGGGQPPIMVTETGVNLVEVFSFDALNANSSPPLTLLNHDFLLYLHGN